MNTKEIYDNIEKWLGEIEDDIQDLKNMVTIIENRIKKYKQWKENIEKELEDDN